MGIFMGMAINADAIRITPEILSLIAELDEFKGAWRALGTLAPERLLALRKVATIESAGASTRIEGSKLSDKDVRLLIENLEIRTFDSRDEQEVAGYAEVMEMVFANFDQIDITENYIRQLHRDLLRHSTKDARHRGDYKTAPNNVIARDADGGEIGIVLETATPFETHTRMSELVDWFRRSADEGGMHPLLSTAIFIVEFLAIHPFQDGNGRLSRIITTLLLLRRGYAYVPYSSLESVIEKSKPSYYIALRATQETMRRDEPDWQPWIVYFLRSLRQQKQSLEAKMERELILVGKLTQLSVEILEMATAQEKITNGQIVTLTGANRNTVKKHLQALVKSNHLSQHGKGKGTWYSVV